MKRILVLRGGALGDFIVTLPALRWLRQRWPSAQIELVGNSRAAGLGAHAGFIDVVHSQHEARWNALYGDAPLSAEFRAWLNAFDLVVSYWADPHGDLTRHFASHPGRVIFSHPHPRTTPAAAHFCEPLAALGLSATDYSVRLEFSADAHREAERRLAGLRHFAAFHPGSGSPQKNWPAERWSELAARLRRPLLIVSGEAERDLPFWPAYMTLRYAHDWPLPVLGAALSQCTVFVGHDSGVSHLAAAAGADCTLLFGPTDPAIWAPPGDNVHVLRRSTDLGEISVDAVVSALTEAERRSAPGSTTNRQRFAAQTGPA